MLCLECGELVEKRITYLNLFSKNIDKICNTCFTKYIFIQELDIIPNGNTLIYINTLFDREVLEPLAFMSFLKPYYLYYLKKRFNALILYFDTLDKVVYNIIQNIPFGDVYIIELHNEKKKENDYDGRSNW